MKFKDFLMFFGLVGIIFISEGASCGSKEEGTRNRSRSARATPGQLEVYNAWQKDPTTCLITKGIEMVDGVLKKAASHLGDPRVAKFSKLLKQERADLQDLNLKRAEAFTPSSLKNFSND